MIKEIKWNNYNILGNLTLKFTKTDVSQNGNQDGSQNESPYDTIILAGENGTGKTTILDTLSIFLNGGSILPFDYIDYNVGSDTFHITPDTNDTNSAIQGFHSRKNLANGNEIRIQSNRYNQPDRIEQDLEDIRHYGFAYSKARSGFNTKPVKSTTTQQVDKDKYEPDDQEDFTRIKQLLIDIDGQDSSYWKQHCNNMMKNNQDINEQAFKTFKEQSIMHRFEKAFNEFFETIKYSEIDDTNISEKKILFQKHGHKISIDQLSTGEKQIVFRGAHLLRNMNNISGGIVLIDEPELSMHPIWQRKILNYYRRLFTNNGKQEVQMLIATHSEYVIQSALEDRDNVLVIVLTDDNGTTKSEAITAPNVLPTITAAETNYLAFGVASTDYHIELYGYLQTKTMNHHIKSCDAYIAGQSQYDTTKHEKIDNSFQNQSYKTLPTYIRNAIDHPNSNRSYTYEELKTSIELLRELCK